MTYGIIFLIVHLNLISVAFGFYVRLYICIMTGCLWAIDLFWKPLIDRMAAIVFTFVCKLSLEFQPALFAN